MGRQNICRLFSMRRRTSKMIRINTRILGLLLGISSLALAGGERPVDYVLPPTDETVQAPDLARFLDDLRKAVEERNVQFVQAALAEDVQLGFGPHEDDVNVVTAALNDADSELWQRLESSVKFGGTFTSRGERARFCVPYFYSAFPDHLDPLEHQVIVEPSIEALSVPNESGREIALPDFAIVRTDLGSAATTKDENGRLWARVYLKSGPAYVPATAIRSPLDSRTCFEKRGSQWRVTAVVAGA